LAQKTSDEESGTCKKCYGLKRPPMKKEAPIKMHGTQKTSDEKEASLKTQGAKNLQ
jgi:hypothetical protein